MTMPEPTQFQRFLDSLDPLPPLYPPGAKYDEHGLIIAPSPTPDPWDEGEWDYPLADGRVVHGRRHNGVTTETISDEPWR